MGRKYIAGRTVIRSRAKQRVVIIKLDVEAPDVTEMIVSPEYAQLIHENLGKAIKHAKKNDQPWKSKEPHNE